MTTFDPENQNPDLPTSEKGKDDDKTDSPEELADDDQSDKEK